MSLAPIHLHWRAPSPVSMFFLAEPWTGVLSLVVIIVEPEDAALTWQAVSTVLTAELVVLAFCGRQGNLNPTSIAPDRVIDPSHRAPPRFNRACPEATVGDLQMLPADAESL